MVAPRWLRLLAVCSTLLLPACGRHPTPLAPRASVSPRPPAASAAGLKPTLENLWPHEDGRAWTYHGTADVPGLSRTPPLFASPDLVPVVTLDDAERLLTDEAAPAETLAALRIAFGYRLEFRGTVEAFGVTAQNLVATTWEERPMARPAITPDTPSPMLLHGGIWFATPDSIMSFPSAAFRSLWKYLESDFRPGHEFTLLLSRWSEPGVDPTVVLSARVLSVANRGHGRERWKKAVEVLYLLDEGIWQVRDPVTEELGYARPFLYGTVLYVPGIGPVRAVEWLRWAGTPPSGWIERIGLELADATAP